MVSSAVNTAGRLLLLLPLAISPYMLFAFAVSTDLLLFALSYNMVKTKAPVALDYPLSRLA